MHPCMLVRRPGETSAAPSLPALFPWLSLSAHGAGWPATPDYLFSYLYHRQPVLELQALLVAIPGSYVSIEYLNTHSHAYAEGIFAH